MKKIISFVVLSLFLFIIMPVSAAVNNTDWTQQSNVERVNKIGQALLSK